MRHSLWLVAVAAGVLTAGCGKTENTPPIDPKEAPITAKTLPEGTVPQSSVGPLSESVVADFTQRVKDYVALRSEQGAKLAPLPDRATPKQIDTRQRELHAVMAKARANAKQGDIFVPDMQTFVRGLIKRVLSGPDGPRIRESLMDENPRGVAISVNSRYPDHVPMSTMPTDVLAALPRLPEDLEYRFVGDRLILLDVQSHLIVDFVDNTITA